MTENRPKTTRTLEVKPSPGEMVKPSELIDVKGATGLSLQDRRIYRRIAQGLGDASSDPLIVRYGLKAPTVWRLSAEG